MECDIVCVCEKGCGCFTPKTHTTKDVRCDVCNGDKERAEFCSKCGGKGYVKKVVPVPETREKINISE